MEKNIIYNEDCKTTIQRMIDCGFMVNMVLTSPPYNTNRNYAKGNKEHRMDRHEQRYLYYNDRDMSNEEYTEWSIDIFNLFDKILSANGCVLYNLSYSSENTSLLWDLVSAIQKETNFIVADCIVWKKTSALPNNVSSNKLTRICEFVFLFCRKSEFATFHCNKQITGYGKTTGQAFYENIYNFIEAPNNDKCCSIHKAAYSTLLCRKLLSVYAPPQSVVYDPFMGTGTTAVACVKEKLDYVGSEICKEYVDYATKRIHDESMQLTLF